MKGLLKFIGTGSAFNSKLGCNSAYIIKNNSLILFDCGGDVFSKLKELEIIKGAFNSIYVFITHIHPDHVGSLGDLIYYNYFILKKNFTVISIDDNIGDLLSLMGVKPKLYNLSIIHSNSTQTLFETLTYEAVETKHCEGLKSCGFKINIDNKNIYYSGDSCAIQEIILNDFLNGYIDELYQDTCELIYENNPHFAIDLLAEIIPEECRHKVFCMHLDEHLSKNSSKIINLGFNKVVPIYKNDFIYTILTFLPTNLKSKLL